MPYRDQNGHDKADYAVGVAMANDGYVSDIFFMPAFEIFPESILNEEVVFYYRSHLLCLHMLRLIIAYTKA